MTQYRVRLINGLERILTETELVVYKKYFEKSDIRSVRKI
jgi:hypothetical protein